MDRFAASVVGAWRTRARAADRSLRTGLAAATTHAPVGKVGHSAGHRMDANRPDQAAVQPY
jgi:hypothetical protein